MKLREISHVLEEMSDISQHVDIEKEMDRIVDHWKESGVKQMSDNELAEAIGNELEQLEYSPEDINHMIPAIIARLKQR